MQAHNYRHIFVSQMTSVEQETKSQAVTLKGSAMLVKEVVFNT